MPRNRRFTPREKKIQLALNNHRVASYLRMSSEEQVNSLDAQERRHADFATLRGLDRTLTFREEAVSATATPFLQRPAARQMLAAMERTGIHTILILRVDRVFRSIKDFVLTLSELEARSISLRFIDPDLDYSTSIGKLVIQQLVAIAEMEGDFRTARQDDVYEDMRARRVAITANAIAYGWQANGTAAATSRSTGEAKTAIAPHPAQQTILRWIKDEHSRDSRYGVWTRIARQLNTWHIPTPVPKGTTFTRTCRKTGTTRTLVTDGIWKASTVQSVLRYYNPATEAELPGGFPSLDQAIHSLTHPTANTSSAA